MAEYPDKEEQYLLRVQNKAVADSLRTLLRGTAEDVAATPLDIKFSSKDILSAKICRSTFSSHELV